MSGRQEKTKKVVDLQERLERLELVIDEIRINAASLEGKRRFALEERVEELGADLAAVAKHSAEIEGKIGVIHRTLKQVVDASNAASVLLGAIERFLDRKEGADWDDGIREETENQANLLRRRREIMTEGVKAREKTPEELAALGAELWDVAKEAGTESADVAYVVSLYLKAREIDRALDVVEEVQKSGIALDEEVAEMMQQLVKRCAALAKEQKNEVQEARISRVPALVDPSGRPVSSR